MPGASTQAQPTSPPPLPDETNADPNAPAPAASSPEPIAAPEAEPAPVSPVEAGHIVGLIRSKLGDAGLTKGANPDDLAALAAFYASRSDPLWMTEMGFTAKGQAALFEIGKADDWGLDAAAFELPRAEALPANEEAEALAEIKLDLAILKYARYARGGRLTPSEISALFDVAPPLRDPKTVLAEIAAADAPDAYLRSLHPKHEQFARLRQALLKARGVGSTDAKATRNSVQIQRLIVNLERWRWMPEDLGALYVWNNSPEFMLYVVKDGKQIYADKTLVGTIGYATPVFSADMRTIVFNPDWIAPPTVVTENLLPPLRDGSYSILSIHKLSVSYNGKPVDPTSVNWSRANILSYTFSQKPGPDNVLGKVKFLFPNKHTVYMHDTLPVRRKYFQTDVRMIGHECVRMEKPEQFAQVLLAEDKGWPASQVKQIWDGNATDSVTIEHKIPVHMTYFTSVVDESGKVATYPDIYGLDAKMAAALFGSAKGFPAPPPEPKHLDDSEASAAAPSRRAAGGSDIAASLQGFAGD